MTALVAVTSNVLVRLAVTVDTWAPLAANTDAAMTTTLPGDTPLALVVSAEDAESPTEACTTLRPLAAAAKPATEASTTEPIAIWSPTPAIDDDAVNAAAANVLCVPAAVSVAVAARVHVLDEIPLPVGVSVDSADRLADPELTPYPMATSTDVAVNDEGVMTVRPDVARRPAALGTTSVARASSVAFADRCSVPRATPNPLAVLVDVAARATEPNAE